jgi:chromosome segregation ATPase
MYEKKAEKVHEKLDQCIEKYNESKVRIKEATNEKELCKEKAREIELRKEKLEETKESLKTKLKLLQREASQVKADVYGYELQIKAQELILVSLLPDPSDPCSCRKKSKILPINWTETLRGRK